MLPSAAIGAVCGAWAGVLVDLGCPLTNAPHVLVGHVLPIVILVTVGTILGRSILGAQHFSARGSRTGPSSHRAPPRMDP